MSSEVTSGLYMAVAVLAIGGTAVWQTLKNVHRLARHLRDTDQNASEVVKMLIDGFVEEQDEMLMRLRHVETHVYPDKAESLDSRGSVDSDEMAREVTVKLETFLKSERICHQEGLLIRQP